MAPEILLHVGHNKAADYWSFGVLLFEMIFGYTTFYSKGISQTELFRRIIKVSYSFPQPQASLVSSSVCDMIEKLLVKGQTKRLGSFTGGANDIKKHPFFCNVDFDEILQRNVDAPWVPHIKSPKDTSNFEVPTPYQSTSVIYEELDAIEQKMFDEFC